MEHATEVIFFVLIITVVVLVPIGTIAARSDDVAQQAAQVAVSNFVDTVSNEGQITEEAWTKFQEELPKTHSFEPSIVLEPIDENIGNKSAWTSSSVIGENEKYSIYTSQILDDLEKKGVVPCKAGDTISVSVKNTDTTIYQSVINVLYKVSGKGTSVIGAQATRTIKSNGK